ncbi:MAG: CoB--CoM heterodisulfide reductase iron-sulfur subunit A family protein, partial [Chloroflexi bacterium]|nr:CoB--CoM heterodisulfide reductase iron-sulfur subunit A family protein [Chloroflexota bacterium]
LVERSASLGGNAVTVCCKAVKGQCQICGGCLLSDRLTDLRKAKDIEVFLETAVNRVERESGGFVLHLAHGSGAEREQYADAVILATGFDHVDAHTKGPYGYGILPMVTTGEEMERRLKDEGQGAYDDLKPGKVAFIQCVGSRDEHVGRGYCSQVCCRYACRLARLLRARYPEAEVTLFKMDIQASGRDMRATWEALSSEGIRVVAGLPAVIRRSPEDPQRARFLYDDILAGGLAHEDFDLIVLSTGIQPRRDAEAVAELFGINQDETGFFAVGDDGYTTIVPGVFVAGCCQAPRSMAESVAHASEVTQACLLYLREAVHA